MTSTIDIPIDLNAAKKALCEKSFFHFVKNAWPIVCQDELIHGKHMEIICNALQDAADRKIQHLLINIPPGHTKSLLTSILFPAWLWIKSPSERIIVGSHSLGLTTDLSIDCRTLIESDWYQSNWKSNFALNSDLNTKTHFKNSKQGERSISSPGSKPTGKSAEFIIIDDAHDINDISDQSIKTAINWFEGGLISRIRNPKRGVVIVIGQRVAVDDISGHCIETGKYTHINLPAEYEGSDNDFDWRGEPGELLWPDVYTAEFLADRKKALGTAQYEAIYQQNPSIPGGNIVKTEWLKFYTVLPERFDQIIASWDLTFTASKTSDFVVGGVLARKGADVYLIDMVRGRFDFPEQIKQIKQLSNKYPKITSKLIENKANGAAAIATLKNQIQGLVPVNPSKDKIARLNAVIHIIEAGNFYLPKESPYSQDTILELTNFPKGKHDDIVDMLTQGLQRLADTRSANAFVEYYY